MKNLSPMAARFSRTHEGYVHPARLDAWEQAALNLARGRAAGRSPPGGSISGSDDGWDDSDE